MWLQCGFRLVAAGWLLGGCCRSLLGSGWSFIGIFFAEEVSTNTELDSRGKILAAVLRLPRAFVQYSPAELEKLHGDWLLFKLHQLSWRISK